MRAGAIILLVLTSLVWGTDEWESDYPLIAGDYEVIGRRCESGKLFAGRITIDEVSPNVFTVTRLIDGRTTKGSGQVEFATPDQIPVFRIHFVEDGMDMEGTLLWRGDLDNDGRFSGYVYPKGYQGKKPGIEALFAAKEIAEQDETEQPATRAESEPEGGDKPQPEAEGPSR
jgi:hypothetical protein